MWRLIICPGICCFQSGTFSLRWLKQPFAFGAYQGWICWHPPIPLNAKIITPWKLHYFWGPFGVECLQPSLDISGKLCISFFCISSSSSVQVPGRTCQRLTQTSDSGGTMLDGGTLASHSYQHVGRHSLALSHYKRSHVGCFRRPCTQGSAISAFNPLAAERCVLCRQGSLPQSVRQWVGQLDHLHQRSTSSIGRNGQVGVLKRVYQIMPYLPLN